MNAQPMWGIYALTDHQLQHPNDCNITHITRTRRRRSFLTSRLRSLNSTEKAADRFRRLTCPHQHLLFGATIGATSVLKELQLPSFLAPSHEERPGMAGRHGCQAGARKPYRWQTKQKTEVNRDDDESKLQGFGTWEGWLLACMLLLSPPAMTSHGSTMSGSVFLQH